MITERLTKKILSIKIGVSGSQISSIRTGEEKETVVRVFDRGKIGIASAIGNVDLNVLQNQAEKALSLGLTYPFQPNSDQHCFIDNSEGCLQLDEMTDFTDELLKELRSSNPDLIFGHGVFGNMIEHHYQNSLGLDLYHRSSKKEVGFTINDVGSPNILDNVVVVAGPKLDLSHTLEKIQEITEAHQRVLPAPPLGKRRVLFSQINQSPMTAGPLFSLFSSDCNALSYGRGSSIFQNKLGEDLGFHPLFHLVDSRDNDALGICPFDAEGTIRVEPNLDLIRGGKLQNIACSKRDSLRFELMATGSAIGGRFGDEIHTPPQSGIYRMRVIPTVDGLEELLQGEPATLLWFQAGGSVTRTGDVALPVMASFEMDKNGKIIGRYPSQTYSGNLYEIFGKDFVGMSKQGRCRYNKEGVLMTHMRSQ